ncbi:MAG: TlpA family protein disulfide reductase [Phycisphaerae bacterium]|nr:TlpA family protein disulfide reductase [Phycisphaerae bacterium]
MNRIQLPDCVLRISVIGAALLWGVASPLSAVMAADEENAVAATKDAAMSTGRPPVAAKVLSASSGASKTRSVEPYKLDESIPAEASWSKYLDAAKAAYGFDEGQLRVAESILESCVSRAKQRRATIGTKSNSTDSKSVDATDGQALKSTPQSKMDKELTSAISKLTDEFVFRVDSIARLDQIERAADSGFVTPRQRVAAVVSDAGGDAPAFRLTAGDGKVVSLADMKGRVVVLSFWASWCGWCKKSMPEIQKLHEEFKGQAVDVIGVNCSERDKSMAQAKNVIDQGKFTFPVYFGQDDAARLFGVTSFPTLFVLGPDGKIIHKQKGYRQNLGEFLKPMIDGALKSAAADAGGTHKSASAAH